MGKHWQSEGHRPNSVERPTISFRGPIGVVNWPKHWDSLEPSIQSEGTFPQFGCINFVSLAEQSQETLARGMMQS